MIINWITGTEQLHALTATGAYTVEVHDWNGLSHTGTYELGLEWLAPAAKQCGGQVLTCGAPLTPAWPGGMRHDHFSFAGTAGDRLWLTLARTGGDAGYTPGVTVYDPNGNPVLDTATAAGIDPLLNLGVTGTYVLQVHDEAGTTNTGTYTLAANWLLPAGKRCAVSPVGCDNTVAAAIGSAAQVRLHTFPAKAGDSLRLSFAKTGGAPAFAPLIRLYDPSGGFVAELGSAGTLALDNLPAQGFYLAYIHDASLLSAGSYSLQRTAVAPGDCWAADAAAQDLVQRDQVGLLRKPSVDETLLRNEEGALGHQNAEVAVDAGFVPGFGKAVGVVERLDRASWASRCWTRVALRVRALLTSAKAVWIPRS